MARSKNPEIRILVSLGWGQKDYSLGSKNAREFAASVRDFIERHRLDGIDLDYEISDDPIDLDGFRELVREIRKSIGGDKLFTITPDESSMSVWDGSLVDEVFDYVQL